MIRRFLGSLAIGAIVAGALVAYDDNHNHAGLVKMANGPHAKGVHESVASILTSGFIFTALIVAAIVFVIAKVAARRRRSRNGRGGRQQGYAAPRYRAGAGR